MADNTTEVDDKDLQNLMTKAKQIIEGRVPYSSNREAYLETVVDYQIGLGYEIKDILEDMGL
jgi:hypothetical protein